MRARTRRVGPWLAAWGLLPALACAPPARTRYEEALAETPPASTHGVHAERLVEVMRGLDRLTGARLPEVLDTDLERARRARELSAVALEIAASARLIPVSEALDPSARRDYEGHVRALESQARELADEAAVLNRAERDARVASLRAVCASCHQRYRQRP